MFSRSFAYGLFFGASLATAACSSSPSGDTASLDGGGGQDATAPEGGQCQVEVTCYPLPGTDGGACGAPINSQPCEACPSGFSETNGCTQDAGGPDGGECAVEVTCYPLPGTDGGACGAPINSQPCQACPSGWSATNECAADGGGDSSADSGSD